MSRMTVPFTFCTKLVLRQCGMIWGNVMTRKCLAKFNAIAGLLLILTLPFARAEEAKNKEAEPPPVPPTYYNIQPDIITTFPKPGKSKRLGYISIQVHLAIPEKYLETIEKHEPILQDTLVMHFSSQTEASIKSLEGREKLRTDALKMIQDVMLAETGFDDVIEDLLFTKYIWN